MTMRLLTAFCCGAAFGMAIEQLAHDPLPWVPPWIKMPLALVLWYLADRGFERHGQ